MGECPICYETLGKKMEYMLSGCSHSICLSCARECKDRSDVNSITVNGQFFIFTDDIYQPIKCPLCRREEKKMTVDEFKCFYPDMYDEWFQLELNCDDDGYSYYDEFVSVQPLKHKTVQRYSPQYRVPKIVKWNRKSNKMKGKRKI
jgi:hypothetical protein